MSKLDKLERRVHEAETQSQATRISIDFATLKQMIQLMRQMREALECASEDLNYHYDACTLTQDAIAAFDKFDNGE